MVVCGFLPCPPVGCVVSFHCPHGLNGAGEWTRCEVVGVLLFSTACHSTEHFSQPPHVSLLMMAPVPAVSDAVCVVFPAHSVDMSVRDSKS